MENNKFYIDLDNDPKNEKCLKCTEECKQSNKVTICYCPYFQGLGLAEGKSAN